MKKKERKKETSDINNNHASKRRIYTRITFRKRYPHELSFSFAGMNVRFHKDKTTRSTVSHTTDEMIFQWDPDVPLVVDENIELPQLQLVKNYTADCTQVYSTGECCRFVSRGEKKKRNLVLILFLINRFKSRHEIEEESKGLKVNLFSREWPRLFNSILTLSSRVFNVGTETGRNK